MAGDRGNFSKNNNGSSSKQQWSSAIVDHVVLDDTDSRISEFQNVRDGLDSKDTGLVGCIFVRELTDLSSNNKELPIAIPFNDSVGIPLKGETVRILRDGVKRYYDRIYSDDINTGNAVEDSDLRLYGASEKTSKGKSKDYSESSQTTTPRKSSDGGEDDRKQLLGDYFEPTQINKLKFYEGDRIIQSRFGQSIRFSGYNNFDNILSPTLIIRNRQSDVSLNELDEGSVTEEDINRDGSTILLSSNDYKLDFQPGIVDDGGNSDFETTPINFELPKEYVGFDQMLLNSERVIISAKSQEMIFFSKGNYGFISDGKFTIDNGFGGADLDFGDDVNITTDRNASNVFINTGDGNILLNTDDQGNSPSLTGPKDSQGNRTLRKEPLVRGNTLVELLGELIDAINKQVYNTPAGPSAVGPTNRSTFNDIKSKLQDALSTLNYTE